MSDFRRGLVYKYGEHWIGWAGLRYRLADSWREAYDYAHTNTPIPAKAK